VKTSDYVDRVFRAFETITQGDLTDAQLEALAGYGVTTIILHEDLFPEKVSPCSVGTTLRRLLAHPRLRLLRQDGPVWAFSILSEPRAVPAAAKPPLLSCTPFWHFPDGGCVPSSLGKPFLFLLHRTADWRADEGFAWHVFRADGSVETHPPGRVNGKGDSFMTLTGDVAVRDVFFAKTPFVETATPDHPVFLPACDLLHTGYSLLATDGSEPALSGSVFLPAETPACAGVYGPNLMLPAQGPGTYALLWRGKNLEHTEISFALDGQFLGARPATEPWEFPAPDRPVLLRVGLHLQGGAERGDIVVDGLELSYTPAPMP
jgi:hypothetical protein